MNEMNIKIERINYECIPYANTFTTYKITCNELSFVNNAEDFVVNLCTKCLTKVDKKYNDSDRDWYEPHYKLRKQDGSTYLFTIFEPYVD